MNFSDTIRTFICLCGRGYFHDDPLILNCVQSNGGGRILKRYSHGVNAVLVHPNKAELDTTKKRKLDEYIALGLPVLETNPKLLSSNLPPTSSPPPVSVAAPWSQLNPISSAELTWGLPAAVSLQPVSLEIIPINGKKFQVDASLGMTVAELKLAVARVSGVPSEHQRLLCSGQDLDTPHVTLEQAGVGKRGSYAIHLVRKQACVPVNGYTPASVPATLPCAQDLESTPRPPPIQRSETSHILLSTHAIDLTGSEDIIPVSKKRKAKSTSPPKHKEEKRLTRFRGSCPSGVMQRIARAKTQRLFLITRKDESREEFLRSTFAVMGSTGNIYEVAIEQRPFCNCPDFQKGNICKHILFVFLKVLRVPDCSSYIYQTSLLQSELSDIFKSAPKDPQGCMARKEVITAYKKVTGDAENESEIAEANAHNENEMRLESDCPVCFEEIQEGGQDTLVYCRTGCKKALHKECQSMWARSKKGQEVTCIFCRAPWQDEPASTQNSVQNVSKVSEGYVNLGDLQGQNAIRDTSQYSEWFGGHSRGYRAQWGRRW